MPKNPKLKREAAQIWADTWPFPPATGPMNSGSQQVSAHGPRCYITSKNPKHHQIVALEVPRAGEWIPPGLYVEPPVTVTPCGELLFEEISVEGSVLAIPLFHPEDLITHLRLWLRINDPSGCGGLTRAEFSKLCAQCARCKHYTSRRSRDTHRCWQRNTGLGNKRISPRIQKKQKTRVPIRDVVQLYRMFHSAANCPGLTTEELEYMFIQCPECRVILTRAAGYCHIHRTRMEQDGEEAECIAG